MCRWNRVRKCILELGSDLYMLQIFLVRNEWTLKINNKPIVLTLKSVSLSYWFQPCISKFYGFRSTCTIPMSYIYSSARHIYRKTYQSRFSPRFKVILLLTLLPVLLLELSYCPFLAFEASRLIPPSETASLMVFFFRLTIERNQPGRNIPSPDTIYSHPWSLWKSQHSDICFYRHPSNSLFDSLGEQY